MSVAQILTGDWPYSTEKCGMRLAQLVREGRVRHDIIIEKAKVGKIIGSRGATLQAIIQISTCEIFVLDKEGAPPGCSPDQRLICLVGYDTQVSSAMAEIDQVLNIPGYVPEASGGGGGYGQQPPPQQQMYQAQGAPQQQYQQQQQQYQQQQYQQPQQQQYQQ